MKIKKKKQISIFILREMLSVYGIDSIYTQGVEIYTEENKNVMGQNQTVLFIVKK